MNTHHQINLSGNLGLSILWIPPNELATQCKFRLSHVAEIREYHLAFIP